MSLLDTASLIVTPNGYKEGKLYSVIPTDGSGDLSVTRATTATRVNSAGLVELVPYNLLQYSEQFNNAVWATYAAGTGVAPIITANSTTAPNGTLTADKVVLNAGASATPSDQSQLYQLYAVTSGKTYTLSFYAKGENGGEQIMVRHAGAGSYTKITLTNQWARYTLTETAPLDISVSVVFLIRRGLLEPINASATFYLWGAQLVEGSVAKDYQKTETRLNIPRLDYSNGTCPSILVEPQRTNTLIYSEQLDNSNWVKNSTTISANAATAPNGLQTADKLISSAVSGFHNIAITIPSKTASTPHTFSFYAKAGEIVYCLPNLNSAFSGTQLSALINLTNGTASSISAGLTVNIVPCSNGWYRIALTATAAANTTAFNAIINTTNAAGSASFTGNGTSGIYVWGTQMEVGSYATSYIPTTSASVTRNADVISKTGISSLIGQTEGTVFLDFYYNGSSIYFIPIEIYGMGRASFYVNASKVLFYEVSGTSVAIPTLSPLVEGRYKMAFVYKLNDFALYSNGVLQGTFNSGAVPTMNALNISDLSVALGAYKQQIEVNTLALWKTRLTNTQLAQLTTI